MILFNYEYTLYINIFGGDYMKEEVVALVLAAGKGTRMKSDKSKLVHKIYGKELVKRVVETAQKAGVDDIITVVGYKREQVQLVLGDSVNYAYQEEMLGTGHAVMQAESYLKDKHGKIVVLNGDVPILRPETLKELIDKSIKNKEYATILTAIYNNPTGYGRIIRDIGGNIKEIIEEKDLAEDQKSIQEINAGIYCFDIQELLKALKEIKPNNAQNEYYITDVIEILRKQGDKVGAYKMPDFSESLGVNDRVALAEATRIMQARINKKHMEDGVTFIDPATAYIDAGVKIGNDTVIEGCVTIKGNTEIGSDCLITSGSRIIDSKIGNGVTVTSSTLEEAQMDDNTDVGPNSHLRPKAVIRKGAHLGNFVEVKNSTIGAETKISHLSYIGDSDLGTGINIGCGCATANYSGNKKSRTTIKDGAFIGCHTCLVAPVEVGENAYTAAGSTVTENVPDNSLAVARSRQTVKKGWVKIKQPYKHKV